MNIDEMTIGEMKEIMNMMGKQSAPVSPYVVGKAYLFRLVTNYWTGRVVSVGDQEIVIEDAAWIADTGRFEKALSTGELSEVEPVVQGTAILGRGAVVDCCEWTHPLSRSVK